MMMFIKVDMVSMSKMQKLSARISTETRALWHAQFHATDAAINLLPPVLGVQRKNKKLQQVNMTVMPLEKNGTESLINQTQ